jgi:hypothetical protein
MAFSKFGRESIETWEGNVLKLSSVEVSIESSFESGVVKSVEVNSVEGKSNKDIWLFESRELKMFSKLEGCEGEIYRGAYLS